VTARHTGVDDPAAGARRGSAVRGSSETLLCYDLAVLAADETDVVRAAGGWLCDRARAGWRVTVWLPSADPAHPAVAALTVLGVRAQTMESPAEALRATRTAAVALDAGVLADPQCRAEVLRRADDAGTEVTVWGNAAALGTDVRFHPVQHRLSAAARAFKQRAVSGLGEQAPDAECEYFVSAALWYPTDGADLEPRS
jgi:hypothetical protein